MVLVMLMHTGVLDNGYIGVDVFFGLSGFLITTLLCEQWERTGRISFRRFYERRARRLLPALLLVVALFTVVYLVTDPFNGWPLGSRVATTLLFVNNWVAGFGNSDQLGSLAPTWSLAQEEQFYLIWPLVLALLLNRRLPPAAVLGVLLATIAGVQLAVPEIEQHIQSYNTYFSPLDRGTELLFGCAGAIAWRNRLLTIPDPWRNRVLTIPDPWRDRVRLRLGAPSVWRSLLCFALAGAFAGLLFEGKGDTREIYLAANALAVPLIIALITTPACPLTKLIGSPPLRYIGRISYCLYLCHLMIRNLLYHYLPGLPTYLYVLLTFAFSFALAGASWRLLEARVLSAGWPRRSAGVAARRAPAWSDARGRRALNLDRA